LAHKNPDAGVADHIAGAGKLMAVTIEPTLRYPGQLKHFSKKRLKITPGGTQAGVGRAGINPGLSRNPDTIAKQYPYHPFLVKKAGARLGSASMLSSKKPVLCNRYKCRQKADI
jgi:hypothetical protein